MIFCGWMYDASENPLAPVFIRGRILDQNYLRIIFEQIHPMIVELLLEGNRI